MSLPLRVTAHLIAMSVLVWAMQKYLPQYILITGGPQAWIMIGALLTAMNFIVRPVLQILVLPVKLLATILAYILTNIGFTWLTVWIVAHVDPALAILEIIGIRGWIVITILFGLSNGMLKVLLPPKRGREE